MPFVGNFNLGVDLGAERRIERNLEGAPFVREGHIQRSPADARDVQRIGQVEA
jgi:hypothetical protein